MKVNIRQTGGFLGVDHELEIEDGKATVTAKGKVKRVRQLDDDLRQQLEGLAERVSPHGVVKSASQEIPSDAMQTDITIENGPRQTRLSLMSGDDASNDVYEFLALAGRLLQEE